MNGIANSIGCHNAVHLPKRIWRKPPGITMRVNRIGIALIGSRCRPMMRSPMIGKRCLRRLERAKSSSTRLLSNSVRHSTSSSNEISATTIGREPLLSAQARCARDLRLGHAIRARIVGRWASDAGWAPGKIAALATRWLRFLCLTRAPTKLSSVPHILACLWLGSSRCWKARNDRKNRSAHAHWQSVR